MSKRLQAPPQIPWVRALRWSLKPFFAAAGYQWEPRRQGELRLGLWRKTFVFRKKQAQVPRRLVLVPGFGDSPVSWLAVMSSLTPLLRRRYDEVILVEFPGFSGVLSGDRGFDSMDAMRAALADVLDSLRAETLIGQSLGAWLCALYSADCGKGARPSEAAGKTLEYKGPARMILVNPPGVFESELKRDEWKALFERVATEGADVWRPHIFGKEPMWFRFFANEVKRFLEREETRAFIRSVNEVHLLEEALPAIQAETWLLFSEKDTIIPVACASVWGRSLGARAHPVVLKKIGHSPHMENPLMLSALLAQILLDRKPHPWGSRWWGEIAG